MRKQHRYVLGLNTCDHDVSACLLRDGGIAKERTTREKNASGFYKEVIDYCLDAEGITLDDVSRQVGMKDMLNSRVKYRQAFRPFAPIVLAERAREIYEGLVQTGAWSAGVFYNLGNAAFRQGDKAAAFLAYERAVALEWLCALYYRARLFGSPRILSDAEMAEVTEIMADYGRPRGAADAL